MLKAIVLDFDGVIIDTESEWYYIYRDWLKRDYDYDLKIEDYQVCVGANNQSLFEFLKKDIGEHVDTRGFEQGATKEYIRRTRGLPPMKGVIAFIRKAKERHLKLAIATSATLQKPRFHLQRLQVLDAFDAFSTAELCERVKPAPDLFLKAAGLLKCRPQECLAVEDSGNGLLSARRAHMPCLIVPNPITRCCEFQGYFKKADSLEEVDLDAIIQEFNQIQSGKETEYAGKCDGE